MKFTKQADLHSQDETLDWDVAMPLAPVRRSGPLSVTLQYGGRGVPKEIEASLKGSKQAKRMP